jgi:hypothetical protein
VGLEECIWANDFEIRTLASALKVMGQAGRFFAREIVQ